MAIRSHALRAGGSGDEGAELLVLFVGLCGGGARPVDSGTVSMSGRGVRVRFGAAAAVASTAVEKEFCGMDGVVEAGRPAEDRRR